MNPGFPAWKANGFEEWVRSRYRGKWCSMVLQYVRRYGRLVDGGDLSVLESFSRSKRLNVLKSLIAFAKYQGCYPEFKARVKSFGIRWQNQTSFESFLRMTRPDGNFLEWVEACMSLGEDLRLFTL
ncbi:MAG: hypothetical protein N3F08_01735, partial [Crenarchaeota archaeon]|nr:hypothetical protein [Thermoproteota archaeon]